MIGNFGFSYVGLIYILMLVIPNIIWAKNTPKGYEPSNENKLLVALEKMGQILCTGTVLCFSDYNPKIVELWTIWLFLSVTLMILYEINWVRYFRSGRTVYDFYRSILTIPVPGAILPVAAFFLLGVYGKVIWLVISSIIFGVGHIGIHLQHFKQIKNKNLK